MDENKNAQDEQGKMPLEEDVRENIIDEFGFNEDDDSDRIDKLVSKEMENSKKLSDAIGQKIKQRDKVKELEHKLKKDPPPKDESNDEDLGTKIGESVSSELEKRDLDALDYPDELKEEIKKVATIQNKSIKEALKDSYVVTKIKEYEESEEAEEASISRTNKTQTGKSSFSVDTPPDCDMNTEEGRKEWDEYKQFLISKGM